MKTPTDEQLNLALCKWIGWTHYYEDLWVPPNTTDFSELDCSSLPNYLSSDSPRRLLDEAEARLDDNQYNRFHSKLSLICADDYHEGQKHWCADPVSATARQRVIAILQTVKPEMFQ